MSPGPSLAVILGVAAQSGPRAAAFASWAHATGVGFWATVSLSGWSYLLARAPNVARGVTLIASLYLMSLAYTLWRRAQALKSGSDARVRPTAQSDPHDTLKASLAGLFISISNPKLLIFFTTIYPQVLPEQTDGVSFALAVLIPTVIDGAWYHATSNLSAKVGLLSAIGRHQRLVALLNALVFLLISVRGLWGALS